MRNAIAETIDRLEVAARYIGKDAEAQVEKAMYVKQLKGRHAR